MSTFESLVAELSRDVRRVQPKDALQFCASWFQTRLDEQRARTRDILARHAAALGVPADLYQDAPADLYQDAPADPVSAISPFSPLPPHRHSYPHHRPSVASPFGTLNVPGNALLSPPALHVDPVSPIAATPATSAAPTFYDPFSPRRAPSPLHHQPPAGDFLQPTATILARRPSVSAESIVVDGDSTDPLPVFPKSPAQLARIRTAIKNNFIFRDLDDEQASGVLHAMQEIAVPAGEIVIRQGDVGEYFYVVENGLLRCFVKSDSATAADKAIHHPEFGRKVAEYTPGTSFGELALMYGHPRAATVLAIEPSTLWRVDRITFRTIILKAAHRRRTMYEHFLSTVPLLASLCPEERSKIADALTSKVYADGDVVVRQGEMGDTFFFVEEGEAVVTKKQREEGEGDVKVGVLHKGEYFGELSLLLRAPRAATVSAIHRTDPAAPKLKVAALDAAAFTRLLGPLREIMERNAGESYGPGYN